MSTDMQMTNEVGKVLFSMAGKLGIPVGFMCMKVVPSVLLMVSIRFPNTKNTKEY